MKTSAVPAKNPYFATTKTTNYLVNALCLMDAEAEGLDQGIFLDSDGNVAEGPNMNVAIITHDGIFVVCPSVNPPSISASASTFRLRTRYAEIEGNSQF